MGTNVPKFAAGYGNAVTLVDETKSVPHRRELNLT